MSLNDVFVNVCKIENVKKMWKYVKKFIYSLHSIKLHFELTKTWKFSSKLFVTL